jgi:hypothetical protein
MLFRERVAVYCENDTKHTEKTVWAECSECTSQETYYVSDAKTNRLMVFGETVVVFCENHTVHTDTHCGQNVEFVPHRKHISNTLQSRTSK